MNVVDRNIIQVLFILLGSAIRGEPLSAEERDLYSPEILPCLMGIAKSHDISHLLVKGLSQNGLFTEADKEFENEIFKAVFRYRQLKYDYDKLSCGLETAEIPFIPLKGSIMRRYYPEPWMRTSSDIDILIRASDLDTAEKYFVGDLGYTNSGRSTHDISLYTPQKTHIELHFDLVEEGRANSANTVLDTVWENVHPADGHKYMHEMSDAFFYFYHIAHMAKHFEVGGCGIRPFVDLFILDKLEGINHNERDAVLQKGNLLQFANKARKLSRIWFAGETSDELSLKMQSFIISGGVFGSVDNRVALQQGKKGGKIKYIFSRIFIPYSRLKGYYPVLEKHKWLFPFMQVRRWFMLLNPKVRARAKMEITANSSLDKKTAREMNEFLKDVGIN